MIVSELIEKLKEIPQDLPVYDLTCNLVENCYVNDDFAFGDYANPNCKYGSVVVLN